MTACPALPPGKLELKYLFCAQLADGLIIEQTPEDVSPSDSKRSAFYELIRDGEVRDDIELFQLENGEHRWLVDVRDGHFEVQHKSRSRGWTGAHLWLAFPPPGAKLRLFYFRRRRHHANAHITVGDNGHAAIGSIVNSSQECEYHFGWECENGQRAEMILV